MSAMHLFFYEAKGPNLELKIWPKQILGCLPVDIAHPDLMMHGPTLTSSNLFSGKGRTYKTNGVV
jgi:hypothetical protein